MDYLYQPPPHPRWSEYHRRGYLKIWRAGGRGEELSNVDFLTWLLGKRLFLRRNNTCLYMRKENSWQAKVMLCSKIQVGEEWCLFVWGCEQQEFGWRVTCRSWDDTPTLVMTHKSCIPASQFKGVSTGSKDLISAGWLFSLLQTQPDLIPSM